MSKRGLGKGLSSLLPSETIDKDINNKGLSELQIIDVEPNPDQPRKAFDKEKLESLSSSIKELGVILPILVIKNENGRYQIIAGERRWRAAKLAGLKTIPAIVKDYQDKEAMEVSLIENLQREDLNPIEEAEGYKNLIDSFNMTQEEISKRVGKSRSAITNSIRLLNLNHEIVKMLKNKDLTSGHARALLSVSDKSKQLEIANLIIKNNLNVRQVESLVKNLSTIKKVKKNNPISVEIKSIENSISKILGTKVNIKHGAKKGKIEIEYYGNDDLDRILQFLK